MSGFLLFIVGLAIGSFVNVVSIRLPVGRSYCPACKRTLCWYELLPLASYLALLGKCRTCRAPISIRYPLIELISGFIFLLAPSIPAIIIAELFVILALIDFDRLIIPDFLLICLLILLPFFAVLRWSSVWCALGLGSFFFLLWFVSNGRWIGFGDVKLSAVLGLVFGFPGSLLVVYSAIILGGALGVILLISRRATMKTALPFGSILAFASIIYIIYPWQDIILKIMGFR